MIARILSVVGQVVCIIVIIAAGSLLLSGLFESLFR